jgi:hypothetical protein
MPVDDEVICVVPLDVGELGRIDEERFEKKEVTPFAENIAPAANISMSRFTNDSMLFGFGVTV